MAFATSVDYRIPTHRPQRWGSAADNYVDLNLPDDRWAMTGLETVTFGCPTVRAVPEYPCQELTWATPEGFSTTSKFLPFRIEESITCSTIGAWSPEELEDWAQREARAIYSAALARQVWGGDYTVSTSGKTVADITESTLASEADEVTANGTTPLDALASVEYGLGQRLLGQGMVHMTVDVLARLKSTGVVERIGEQYFTPSGHIVVADYGYYNNGYVYGSGMVGYDTTGFTVNTGWKTSHNDLIVYVSAYAVVEFEACPVVKAAVSTATPANFGGV